MTGSRPAGVVHAGERFSHGGTAFLSWIPGLQDGISVLLRPVHRQSATTHEHHDQWFAGGLGRFQQLALFRRHIQAGAIAALEPGNLQRRFLAFQVGSNADCGDDDVGLARGGHGLGEGIGILARPEQAHLARQRRRIVDGDGVAVALLQADIGIAGLRRPAFSVSTISLPSRVILFDSPTAASR